MKKAMLRKLMRISNKVLGEEEANKIVKNTVDKVLEDIKPNKHPRKKKSEK